MPVYRYVGGSEAEILDTPHKFAEFGSKHELTEEMAKHALSGGIALLPEGHFASLGFTEKELSAPHLVPEEKKRAAWVALHHYRESVLNPVPIMAEPLVGTLDTLDEQHQ